MNIKGNIMLAICPLFLMAAACSTGGKQSESAMQKNAQDASRQISSATEIIQRMEAEPGMKQLIQNAQGIFIVPRYGQAALGIGASGGEGLLLLKQGNNWSDPAFYNFGGLSAGLQIGGEGGALAFILNNERAIQEFKKQNNFQVNANAGITVVNWSRDAAVDLSKADVVAWSDKKGLFGGAAIGLQDVIFDRNDTSGFYGRAVTVEDFFAGKLDAPQEKTSMLKRALSADGSASGGASGSEDQDQ